MIKIAKRMLSPTAINTYLSCPRKYWLRYIKKLKSKPSIHLIRGSAVHQALYQFNQSAEVRPQPENREVEETRLLSLFETAWLKAGHQLSSLGLPDNELLQFKDESMAMLKGFITWRHDNKAFTPSRAEYKIWSSHLGLMGIVDAVHDYPFGPVLVDYKTSKKAEVTADIWRQASLYALLYQDKTGNPPEQIWIHFLIDAKNPQVIMVDDAMISYASALVESVRSSTLSDLEEDYPCTCGGWCEKDFA